MAVNPGTRYFGLAVFEGVDLTYWRIRMLRGKWTRKKITTVEQMLCYLIEHHKITTLVIKKPNPSRTSRNLDNLVSAIGRLARRERLTYRFYSLGDLKKLIPSNIQNGRMDVAEFVANRYPFLIPHLEKERKKKHPYFRRVFEAIAAGIVVSDRHNR